jgi:hypothetical protein
MELCGAAGGRRETVGRMRSTVNQLLIVRNKATKFKYSLHGEYFYHNTRDLYKKVCAF